MSKFTDVISETAIRIAKIVAALRTFSREGEQDPFRSTKIGSVLADTLNLCGERLRTESTRVQVERIAEAIEFECRSVQVVQVLVNLLNNAYDAVLGHTNSGSRSPVATSRALRLRRSALVKP